MLEEIYDVEGGLGGAYIVVRAVGVDLAAALGAGIGVEAGVDPAEPDLRLDVPVAVYGPGVAVGDAGPGSPALVAVVQELAEVAAEELEVQAEMSEIVLSADGVDSEKVSGEALTEPVAGLGLDEPVLPLVSADGPGVDLGAHVEAPFGGETHLDAEVGAEQGVVDQVGLDSNVLGPGKRRDKGQEKSRESFVDFVHITE